MIDHFYSTPSNQVGGLRVYGGYRRQRGAGVFGSMRSFMAPIGRQALRGVKAIAKNKTVRNIAKKAAQKSAEVLTGVAVDALQGRDIGESFKERSRTATLEALTGQSPSGGPPTRRKRKQKRRKSLKQSKRSSSVKRIVAPAPKRRKKLRYKTEDLF